MASNNADWLPIFTQPVALPVRPLGTTIAQNILPIAVSYTNPIAVYSSDYMPTYPQPSRKIYSAWNQGDFWDTSPTTNWKFYTQIDEWEPEWPQPNRPQGSVDGSDFVTSPVLLPEIPSKWLPFISQPSRAVSYASGTTYAAGMVPGTDSTADKWQPAFPQPSRTVQYAPGTIYAAGNFGSLGAGAIHWLSIIVQSSRSVVPLGTTDYTDFVGPPWRPIEPVTVDRWMPTVVQPSRPLGVAQTAEARPLVFNAVPLADKWQPILVQPGRQVVYAKGTEVVQSLFRQLPQTTWQAQLTNQPTRVSGRDRGTDQVWPIFTAPEPINADKWQPTLVQPSRLIVRDLGTVLALDPGGFYQPGDPDPFRGTGAPTGPDPHRGTSNRTIVVPN